MAQLVPFPTARRKQWMEDLIDEGARLNLYDASKLFTRTVREQKAHLRALGVPEDLIRADLSPVSERLKDEIRERTAKLNKDYRLSCDPEDFPDWRPGEVLLRGVY
jgi:hypothetical protein